MSRLTRGAFSAGAASTFGSVAILRSPAAAQTFQYKFAHNLPVNSALHVRLVQMWQAVKRETHGRLSVQTYPNNQLGGDTSMLQQLRAGSIQFFTLAGGILATVVPVAAIESIGFAFKTSKDAQRAMDGALGAYVRKEIEARGLYVFPTILESGMRQMTTSTKPIRTVEDLGGLKVRTPPGPLWVDLFKALGAAPTPINFAELYPALQTHLVDATELPLVTIDFSRIYEAQKYLSITNHMWSGYWLLGNPEAWKALPPDIQAIVLRNSAKYILMQRRDVELLNESLVDKFRRTGMKVNTAETQGFRARLGAFYEHWKTELGPTAWSLLEQYAGKLG